jgi:putative tryptophan/tyrosine transport system substrate-binding protein
LNILRSWRCTASVALVFALLAWAVSLVGAQPSARTPRIGLLSGGTDPSGPLAPQWLAFFDAMRALGWVDGQNMLVERRFAGGKSERVLSFATELVQLGVDVIVATGLPENQAIRRARTTIPVVMVVVDDPVGSGFVRSLARPGGNFTGVAFSISGVGGKYVELLKEAVPSLTRAAILASHEQRPAFLEEMKGAARALGIVLSPPTLVREPAELEPVLARMGREGNGGLIFPSDAFTFLHRHAVVALVAKHRLPAIYTFREHVETGGLMAYGPSIPDRFRQAATFVDKILKGAKPADLPVEQPTRLELVVNLKTAKTLGLRIPPALLVRADQVIE